MYLERNESDDEPIEKIMILKEPPQEETNLETEHWLQGAPMELWALSTAHTSQTQSATPRKITTDNTLPLLNTHQHPLRPDTLTGIKPII